MPNRRHIGIVDSKGFTQNLDGAESGQSYSAAQYWDNLLLERHWWENFEEVLTEINRKCIYSKSCSVINIVSKEYDCMIYNMYTS